MLAEVWKPTSRASTPTISIRFTAGTNICPATVSLVRRMSMRGRRPS